MMLSSSTAAARRAAAATTAAASSGSQMGALSRSHKHTARVHRREMATINRSGSTPANSSKPPTQTVQRGSTPKDTTTVQRGAPVVPPWEQAKKGVSVASVNEGRDKGDAAPSITPPVPGPASTPPSQVAGGASASGSTGGAGSTPPPSAPPPSSSGGSVVVPTLLVLGVGAAAGGAIYVAKTDEGKRRQMEQLVPSAAPIFKMVLGPLPAASPTDGTSVAPEQSSKSVDTGDVRPSLLRTKPLKPAPTAAEDEAHAAAASNASNAPPSAADQADAALTEAAPPGPAISAAESGSSAPPTDAPGDGQVSDDARLNRAFKEAMGAAPESRRGSRYDSAPSGVAPTAAATAMAGAESAAAEAMEGDGGDGARTGKAVPDTAAAESAVTEDNNTSQTEAVATPADGTDTSEATDTTDAIGAAATEQHTVRTVDTPEEDVGGGATSAHETTEEAGTVAEAGASVIEDAVATGISGAEADAGPAGEAPSGADNTAPVPAGDDGAPSADAPDTPPASDGADATAVLAEDASGDRLTADDAAAADVAALVAEAAAVVAEAAATTAAVAVEGGGGIVEETDTRPDPDTPLVVQEASVCLGDAVLAAPERSADGSGDASENNADNNSEVSDVPAPATADDAAAEETAAAADDASTSDAAADPVSGEGTIVSDAAPEAPDDAVLDEATGEPEGGASDAGTSTVTNDSPVDAPTPAPAATADTAAASEPPAVDGAAATTKRTPPPEIVYVPMPVPAVGEGATDERVRELEVALERALALHSQVNELAAFKEQAKTAELLAEQREALAGERQALEEEIAQLKQEHRRSLKKQKQKLTAKMNERVVEAVEYWEEHMHDRVPLAVHEVADVIRRNAEADTRLRLGAERARRISTLEGQYIRLRTLEQAVRANEAAVRAAVGGQYVVAAAEALREGMAGKAPLLAHVQRLRRAAGDDILMAAALDGISTRALANGVLSESQLQQKFLDVKRDVLRVQLVPPAGGLIAHLVSAVVSHLLIRRKGPVTGTAPDAVVSRAEFFIQQGNLEDATRELNQLEGVQREAAWEWLEESRAHLEVANAVRLCCARASVLCTPLLQK